MNMLEGSLMDFLGKTIAWVIIGIVALYMASIGAVFLQVLVP